MPKPGVAFGQRGVSESARQSARSGRLPCIHNARGEVLLGLRTNEPAKDRYFVPGGMITKNEQLAEAFARIVKNETGRPAKFRRRAAARRVRALL